MTSRRWCLTLNNPEQHCTDGRDITLEEIFEEFKDTGLRYAVWQLEKGSEGTPHVQAYCEFGRMFRLAGVSKLLKGHWEVARKPREACIRYCSKEATRVQGPWYFGDSNTGGQGTRVDIMQCKRLLDENVSEREIAQSCFKPWTKYFKAFREYKRISSPSRDFKTQVYVFWGNTGTGKTRLAKLIADAGSTYWLAPNSHWFDDYEGQETVIFDDFYGSIPYSTLLRIMDRTELRLESKGGHINFVAKRLLITSNKQPSEWYDGSKYPVDALRRRIDHEVYFLCENQRTVLKGDALPIFWTGWGTPQRIVDERGDELYAECAEDTMRKHFEATAVTKWDSQDRHGWEPDECWGPDEDQYIGPGYTTEEWELDSTGKQNVVDLTTSDCSE